MKRIKVKSEFHSTETYFLALPQVAYFLAPIRNIRAAQRRACGITGCRCEVAMTVQDNQETLRLEVGHSDGPWEDGVATILIKGYNYNFGGTDEV